MIRFAIAVIIIAAAYPFFDRGIHFYKFLTQLDSDQFVFVDSQRYRTVGSSGDCIYEGVYDQKIDAPNFRNIKIRPMYSDSLSAKVTLVHDSDHYTRIILTDGPYTPVLNIAC